MNVQGIPGRLGAACANKAGVHFFFGLSFLLFFVVFIYFFPLKGSHSRSGKAISQPTGRPRPPQSRGWMGRYIRGRRRGGGPPGGECLDKAREPVGDQREASHLEKETPAGPGAVSPAPRSLANIWAGAPEPRAGRPLALRSTFVLLPAAEEQNRHQGHIYITVFKSRFPTPICCP